MGVKQITPLYRFLFLLVVSVALMIVDHRSQRLALAHTVGSVISLPFQLLLNLPSTARKWISAYYPQDNLYQKYTALAAKQLALETRLQRYDALKAENQRLSQLLAISRTFGDQALLAEIVETELDSFARRVVLDRGMEAGIYLGQPVVTPDGVLGQVSGLGIKRSVVTLLTASEHAIPVQIQRNGLRAIIQGLGVSNQVAVSFLSPQADIRNDDILVTSGIGGGFPVGYKVAQVREIITDANAAFLTVSASPFASIEFVNEVLLLWNAPPAAAADQDPAGQNCE